MNTKEWLHKRLPFTALILALILFVLSLANNNAVSNTDKVAVETASRIEKRLTALEGHIQTALDTDRKELILPEGMPEDMVIYRYINDSLQSWSNQFSIINDNISSLLVFQRLTDRRSQIVSPLTDVTDEISYLNLGPKWYLVKSVSGAGGQKVIAGLEIKNTLIDDARRNENGVNPHLKLPGKYSVLPLTHSGGSAVEIDGKPLFKILYDGSQATPFFDNSMLRWVAVILFAFAIVMFLAGHRTLKVFAAATIILTLLFLMSYVWGIQMNGSVELFSPIIYADGPVLFSLGSLLLINTYITMMVTCLFLIRNRITAMARSSRIHYRRNLLIFGVCVIILSILTISYTQLTLKSLLLNSNISIELYRWNTNILYTVIVYMSYTGLLFCILLLLQCLRPVVKEFIGYRYDMLSTRTLILFAVICSAYFTIISSQLGFRKETDRVTVWANRLSVDRDLSLEIQLRSVEESIAYDQLISALSYLESTEGMIQNRISEYYLHRARQSYNLQVRIVRDNDIAGLSYFNSLLRTGTPIAYGSRFIFLTDSNGRNSYAGLFRFYTPDKGVSRIILSIESNSNREDRGYESILGRFSKPGDINIPSYYSYAKYKDSRLMSYKGNFPYPTHYDHNEKGYLTDRNREVARSQGFVHFMNLVNDD